MTSVPLPEFKSNKGKSVILKDPPNNTVRKCKVKDEIAFSQTDNPKKVFCLQLIEFADSKTELRLCYYIIGKRERMKGKWTYGQYAALMPLNDFRKIVRLAQKKGWI